MRHVGGNSNSLGIIQGDAIRNIVGHAGQVMRIDWINGPFYSFGFKMNQDWIHNNGYPDGEVKFDASRVVPTSNENRPTNIAVKYLIRALN